ncbi:hypothetical protein AAFN75_06275 [Algibacter sp. AS12]|uniref:capsular polysaccharide export protein, LipB/KpsS family n=1 Tax=Algibacter sp. AS12 TaxID=3135773 RepID=UPI00398AA4E6
MKLLFIENRYKTFTFEAIANNLAKEGHEVAFIVQNKDYTPKSNVTNFIIPYPKNISKKNYKPCKDVEQVIVSDRMQNFFRKKGTKYFYYYNLEIDKILGSYKPDFVFGESTAFHELLTIANCKKRNILFLNPSSCRYPKNRFAFYKYDTLEPYKGSNEFLIEKEALEIVDSIANRKAKPDYMKVVKKAKMKTLKDKFLKVKSFVSGDTFNTPNPKVKYQLQKDNKANIEAWDLVSQDEINPQNNFIVLYPLQMQPEANIDVWGIKHRDQLKLIKQLTDQLSDNAKLVVKPNPKSKYELSKELVSYITNNPKVITLKHSVKMDDILKDIDLVVTVTGTIAIECILSNKPVITLVKTLNNDQVNCKYLDNLNELPEIINEVKQNKFPSIDDSSKINYLNTLNSTSYYGRVSDPFSFSQVFGEENMSDILKAFNHIINN